MLPKRKYFWLPILLSWIITSCAPKSDPPNILLVMTDDLGWYDVGFNGNQQVKTPHLDQLASEGVIFSRFYSASAVCSPTRASVLTGRNPFRMNIPTANSGHLPIEEITLPELLKKEGYSTGHFGKWHLGTLTTKHQDANRGGRPQFEQHYSLPTDHGYDEYFATESKVPTFDPMIKPGTFGDGESLRFGWKALKSSDSSQTYGTAYWSGPDQQVSENLGGDNSKVIVDRVLPFIERNVDSGTPFFATVWLHTPHLPVVADSEHRSLYADLSFEEQLYYGTITAMDRQIGRLWDTLNELEVEENTLIFFCSDNGPENGTPGSSGDFRERKRSLYEGGVRVPAFVVWKGTYENGATIDYPAVTSDYMPTLLDILDIEMPDQTMDGKSLVKAIHGEATREKPIGFLFGNQRSWVDDRYKIYQKDGQEIELYDILEDPSELNNLAPSDPEKTKRLMAELNQWVQSVQSSAEVYN